MKVFVWIISVFCLAMAFGCVHEEEPEFWSLIPGDKIPDFSVTLSDGTVWDSHGQSENITVIVFFNTTCPDCRREMPKVQEVYELSLQTVGSDHMAVNRPALKVICIAREESASDIASYWAENHFTVPYSPQPDRSVFSMFADGGIPRVYIVDAHTVISAMFYDEENLTVEALVQAAESAGWIRGKM